MKMNECKVVLIDGVPMISSKDLSDSFGRIHRNVMRDIKNIMRDVSDDFRVLNFEQSTYTSKQNKVLPCYMLTRDGFTMVALGFTGKDAIQWKEKYIAAFNAMERALLEKSSLMVQFNEAVLEMEKDKASASNFGKGLALWKNLKKEHEEKIELIENKLQLALPFN